MSSELGCASHSTGVWFPLMFSYCRTNYHAAVVVGQWNAQSSIRNCAIFQPTHSHHGKCALHFAIAVNSCSGRQCMQYWFSPCLECLLRHVLRMCFPVLQRYKLSIKQMSTSCVGIRCSHLIMLSSSSVMSVFCYSTLSLAVAVLDVTAGTCFGKLYSPWLSTQLHFFPT